MEACILICKKNKQQDRKGKVLFIDAKEDVTRKNAQSYLEEKHIKKISEAYHSFNDIDGFAKIITNDEIIQNNRSKLSVKRYVRPISSSIEFSTNECIANWETSSHNAKYSLEQLITLL